MRRIALFARVPEPGLVKTRLMPALPRGAAATLYRGMLLDALDATRRAHADERYVYWAAGDAPDLAAGLAERVQAGGELGERLASAFAELLLAPGDRAVVYGADSPYLCASAIEGALGALDHADVTLAGARDGGYTLIGLARPAPELFAGVDWGTGRVMEQTLARAAEHGLRVMPIDPIDDVDVSEDVCRLVAWALTDSGPRAPRTRAALREIGLLPSLGS